MSPRKKQKLLLGGIVLLIVLMLVSGLRSCIAKQQPEDDPASAEEEEILAEEETAAVEEAAAGFQTLYCYNGTTKLSFSRDEDGEWVWADDPFFSLDGAYLDELSVLMVNYTPMQTITEIESLENYGLDDPTGIIIATDADGVETTLQLGRVLSDGSYYLKKDDSDTVYVVSPDLHDQLALGIYDMAIPEAIPALTEENIRSVSISGAQRVALMTDSKGGKRIWLAQEEDVTGQVAALRAALQDLRFSACKDYNPSAEAETICGFDEPAAIMVVRYKADNGEVMQMELTIANETLDGKGRYARLDESTTIHTLDNALAAPIVALAQNGLGG